MIAVVSERDLVVRLVASYRVEVGGAPVPQSVDVGIAPRVDEYLDHFGVSDLSPSCHAVLAGRSVVDGDMFFFEIDTLESFFLKMILLT